MSSSSPPANTHVCVRQGCEATLDGRRVPPTKPAGGPAADRGVRPTSLVWLKEGQSTSLAVGSGLHCGLYAGEALVQALYEFVNVGSAYVHGRGETYAVAV